MGAPTEVYRVIGLKSKKNATGEETQDVAAAKPLQEYEGLVIPSSSPEDSCFSSGRWINSKTWKNETIWTFSTREIENYKALFYLDEVVILSAYRHTAEGNKIENGLIGMVEITTDSTNNHVSPSSYNAKHHNISNQKNTPINSNKLPSRLSRQRAMKKYRNSYGIENIKEYAILNDAGLNTKPDIYGEVLLCYNNAVRAKVSVKSAYYLYTQNEYTINVKDGSKLIPITSDFNELASVGAKEKRDFVSDLIFLTDTTIQSNEVTLNATAKNDEGVYECIGTKKVTKIPETLAFPVNVFQFNSIPSDYAHLVSEGTIVTRFMTHENEQLLSQVMPARDETGADGNIRPSVHPIAYKDDYLSEKFEEGTWITDRQANSQGYIKFYHFYTASQSAEWKNTINSYWSKKYTIPNKAISFTVQVMQYMEGLSPVEGYDYKAVIRASFVNTYDPTNVNLRGTLNLYQSPNDSGTVNTGIEWADKVGTPKSINLVLHRDGTVNGITEYFFKKTTTENRYLKITGEPTQQNYPMQYGNFALIPN